MSMKFCRLADCAMLALCARYLLYMCHQHTAGLSFTAAYLESTRPLASILKPLRLWYRYCAVQITYARKALHGYKQAVKCLTNAAMMLAFLGWYMQERGCCFEQLAAGTYTLHDLWKCSQLTASLPNIAPWLLSLLRKASQQSIAGLLAYLPERAAVLAQNCCQ